MPKVGRKLRVGHAKAGAKVCQGAAHVLARHAKIANQVVKTALGVVPAGVKLPIQGTAPPGRPSRSDRVASLRKLGEGLEGKAGAPNPDQGQVRRRITQLRPGQNGDTRLRVRCAAGRRAQCAAVVWTPGLQHRRLAQAVAAGQNLHGLNTGQACARGRCLCPCGGRLSRSSPIL